MPQLWELAPDYARHAETMRVLSTHVLARTRFAATGKFGLRPTAGGLGTGMFGDDFRQVRFSGATLIDEIAGAMRDALLNWPARVSGLIAADLGLEPHLVQTVLQQHVTDLLTEAADRFDPPGLGSRSADR